MQRAPVRRAAQIASRPHAPLLFLQVGQTLRVGGWVKTGRTANKDEFAFLELNDGSTGTNLQVALPRPS